MSHVRRIAYAFAVSALAITPAWADAASEKLVTERAARALADAVSACDKGASAPLDFTATAAPVQFAELMPFDFDMTKLKALQGQCQQAWVGAPKLERLHLQWLRVTMALRDSNLNLLTPQVRKLAQAGSAEAQLLLFKLARNNKRGVESSILSVSWDEGLTALISSADQGHITAIAELLMLYRNGDGVQRDLKEVVRWARRLEGAPPQGVEITPYETEMRAMVPLLIARATLEEEGFPATEARGAFKVAEQVMKAGGPDAENAAAIVVQALRVGRGTKADPDRARAILEKLTKSTEAKTLLAEMLFNGEGGPEDGKRALKLVRDKALQYDRRARALEGKILHSGSVVGYRPQEAIQALAAANDPESSILLAGLLIDYRPRLERPERVLTIMTEQANAGRDDVALALAKLKLSDNSQFTDEDGGRALIKPYADAGNREALWLYAMSQYRNLGSSSFRPMRRDDGLSDAELSALIDEGIRRKESPAFLLKAKLLRAGLVYPQDDRAASDMLKQAARGDNVEALLLLGDAYDDGLGIAKDPKKRLEAWRRAAELGSLSAQSKIANAFTFDTFDRLMTLEEGVTWRIALYNNRYGRKFEGMGIASDSAAEMEFLGLFMGRAMEGGTDAVAEAVMNAFHAAPAGLEDASLVSMGKALPAEIKVAIERRLAREGFYRGSPAGYWGPDVRKALGDWVEAKGFRGRSAVVAQGAEHEAANAASVEPEGELISNQLVGQIWDQSRAELQSAKNERQMRSAIVKINTLALYGNLDARWALLPNYHKSRIVRRAVSAAEITRYGLDLMVAQPAGAEKVEFDFIFNTTQIYQDGKMRDVGQTILAAIRDDVRLHDPLVLGGILKQMMFAPGACEALLASAQRAGIDGAGAEGCDDTTLSALVDFAREKGPAGIDERNKKAAAEVLRGL